MVANFGAQYNEKERFTRKDAHQFAPWVLAEVAHVSLVYGTEHFRSPATIKDLWECCRACQALSDPQLEKATPDALGNFFLRIADQLTYQQSIYTDLARTAALYEQTETSRRLKVMTGGWQERLLGCTLQEYVAAAFVLYTSALRNAGVFDLDWLTRPDFEEATQEVSAEVLREAIDKHYTATPEQYKEMQSVASGKTGTTDIRYRRFGFNPLLSRPAVKGYGTQLVIPVPRLIIRQASPLGIYHAGVNKWKNKFSDDLGFLFEAYVGRNLSLIPDAELLPEISHGSRGGELSVDWFMIFAECVVLVEVKSVRPTEPVRIADNRAGAELNRMLAHAVEQLNKSASLIRNDDLNFKDIPSNLPILGLIVTMEPFYTANFSPIEGQLPSCDIPYRICGVSELEELVRIEDMSIGRFLLDFLVDESKKGWSVIGALKGRIGRRNTVADQGWKSYPWRDRGEERP